MMRKKKKRLRESVTADALETPVEFGNGPKKRAKVSKCAAEVSVNSLWPPVEDYTESSVQYMKRLTAVAVSHILYLRKFFEDRLFDDFSLDYVPLKILKDRSRDIRVRKAVNDIKACFEAIDEKRLKKIYIRLLKNKKTLAETYTLDYAYDTNRFNISLDMKEKEEDNSEELTVMSEQIRALDFRALIEQTVRSLEFKCKSRKLNNCAYFCIEADTSDGKIVNGFDNDQPIPEESALDDDDDGLNDQPSTSAGRSGAAKTNTKDHVLAIAITGQNDRNLTEAQKKMRPYIKKDVKIEPSIKAEPI